MPRSIPSRPAPLALSLSLFASFSAPALAADPVEQQMVVIGSRAPTSISELPGTVWVIEREQLDQQTQAGVPLKEALGQLIPGLDIGSQGRTNNGQNLRGRSVLVMIDGVSLNSSRGISRQFDSIDPFNIERIEVMSGASAVYGGGATGGIINIVTKKGVGGDTRFNTELGARSGFQSHEDHDLRAAQSISGGNDLFNGRLAIAYQKNGAAYDGSGDQVLTDITQTDLQYNRSVDLMGSLGFTFANGHSLDLGLQYYDSGYDGDRGLDLGRNFDALRGRAPYSIKGGVDLDREPESKRHQFNATYHAPEVLGHDLYLQAYYRNEKMAFNPFPTIRYSNSGAINYGTSYYSASQQDTDYYGMKLALVKTWERASLTYGVDLDREKIHVRPDALQPAARRRQRRAGSQRTGQAGPLPGHRYRQPRLLPPGQLEGHRRPDPERRRAAPVDEHRRQRLRCGEPADPHRQRPRQDRRRGSGREQGLRRQPGQRRRHLQAEPATTGLGQLQRRLRAAGPGQVLRFRTLRRSRRQWPLPAVAGGQRERLAAGRDQDQAG